jgi:ferredoxin
MEEKRYQALADHLDRLPGGFAPSSTGAELRLLQRLFTPQEADLAVHLTLDREEAQVIAGRAGLSLTETEQRLDEMADKGLILSVQPEDGPTLYQAAPFIVGIYEFQVNNLNEGLLHDLADYWRTAKPRPRPQTIPQMRTIPVGQSIDPQLRALPYEQADAIVKSHDRYAVAPCICRRHAKLAGGGCDAPEETCLIFGDFADYYVRSGMGRAIDQSEVLDILAKANVANLVLQPSNSQDSTFICCCCGCCCGILGGLKRHPKPAEAVVNAFIAQLEPELCLGCWTCLDRCQMQALTEDGDRVALNADRCIGCGLCVSTCPSGALKLVRKLESERLHVPPTMDDTWHIIAQAQAEMH